MVGDADGEMLGECDGLFEGPTEGDPLGDTDGLTLGERDGLELGLVLGECDGLKEGLADGDVVGDAEGEALGLMLGLEVGLFDGLEEGLDGDALGLCVCGGAPQIVIAFTATHPHSQPFLSLKSCSNLTRIRFIEPSEGDDETSFVVPFSPWYFPTTAVPHRCK